MERLRQERETFNQHKAHEDRWFLLRLVMGYSSVVLLGAVMVVSSYVLLNNTAFPAGVVTAAGGALFVDVLGLLLGVWKIALNPNFLAKLGPVTRDDLPLQSQPVNGEVTSEGDDGLTSR
jgi:hypothetical protein